MLPIKLSVIIPVYNDAEGLRDTLESLVEQDFSDEKYEVLPVDNNSTDETGDVIEEFENRYPDLVRGLEENEIQSSYAARNKGIRESRGEFLAFIDADCNPSMDWLGNGIECLDSDCDLVGGSVEFTFPQGFSGGSLVDASTNMQIESNIEDRGVAKTANLFLKRSVFDSTGLFRDDLVSGGDVEFTKRAVESGFELCFCKDAKVEHPARSLRSLISKQVRVGRGKSELEEMSYRSFLYSSINIFLPLRISTVFEKVDKELWDGSNISFLNLYLSFWICFSATEYGKIIGFVLRKIK